MKATVMYGAGCRVHILQQHHHRRWPRPARAYIAELLPDVIEGRIQPGRVFDWEGDLDKVPDGYKAMNDRKAIKALIEF